MLVQLFISKVEKNRTLKSKKKAFKKCMFYWPTKKRRRKNRGKKALKEGLMLLLVFLFCWYSKSMTTSTTMPLDSSRFIRLLTLAKPYGVRFMM